MIEVVGHRGAAGLAPENTLKGFRRAMELGVDSVECDVHLTQDNHLVVMHDRTVDRTTNGRGAIRDLTLSRIRTLDAGDGEQVPTLDEVLETVRNQVHLLCELKGPGVEAAAAQAVRGHGMVDDVTFTSFLVSRLATVRNLDARYRLGAILPNPTDFELEQAVALGAVVVGVNYRYVNLHTVEAAHARGLEIRGWNPDTWPEQALMIAMGVDSVGTNRPDILLSNLPDAPDALVQ